MKRVFRSFVLLITLLGICLYPNKAEATLTPVVLGNISNAAPGSYVALEILPDVTFRLINDNYILEEEDYRHIAYSGNGSNAYNGSNIKALIDEFSDELSASPFAGYFSSGTKISTFSSSDIDILHDIGISINDSAWTRTPVDGTLDCVWVANLQDHTLTSTLVGSEASLYLTFYLNPQLTVTGSGTLDNPYVLSLSRIPSDNTTANNGPSITGIGININSSDLKANSTYAFEPIMNFSDGSKKILVESSKYLSHKEYSSNKGHSFGSGIIVTSDEITYTSSDPDVAYINIFGRLITKKAGTAVITIKCGNWTTEVQVNVK